MRLHNFSLLTFAPADETPMGTLEKLTLYGLVVGPGPVLVRLLALCPGLLGLDLEIDSDIDTDQERDVVEECINAGVLRDDQVWGYNVF